MTAEDIEAAITPKTKAIFLGYPNNPTGAVMSRERMLEIAAVAEQHDLLIISDEIYDRLVYGIRAHLRARLPGMRDRTILLGGFSKDYAMTGWRIGYACANPDLLGAMRKVHQYTIMSAPTTAQAAACGRPDPPLDDARRGNAPGVRSPPPPDCRWLQHAGLDCFEPRARFTPSPPLPAAA